MNKLKDKGNPWALLPLGLFLVLFVGSGVITGDFYYMPVLVAFMLAAALVPFYLIVQQPLTRKSPFFVREQVMKILS